MFHGDSQNAKFLRPVFAKCIAESLLRLKNYEKERKGCKGVCKSKREVENKEKEKAFGEGRIRSGQKYAEL